MCSGSIEVPVLIWLVLCRAVLCCAAGAPGVLEEAGPLQPQVQKGEAPKRGGGKAVDRTGSACCTFQSIWCCSFSHSMFRVRVIMWFTAAGDPAKASEAPTAAAAAAEWWG
jgi:hypothetical protein